MSSNPLFEAIVWGVDRAKELSHENIVDLVRNAPVYYLDWWKSLLKESPQHLFIETGLLLFIVWLMFIRKTVDPAKISKNMKLSKKEEDWLIETWEPEPLVPELTEADQEVIDSTWIIDGVDGNSLTIRGVKGPVLNLASFDFLSFGQDQKIKKAAKDALEFYGCGSCGPRGFYGTIDQHLLLEDAIAKFMGTAESICYSDGASAVSSAIPAFCKKGDLLLVDAACSEPVLTGCNLSRSTVQFFKHNDMADLRAILSSIADDDRRLKRDALQQRRFIITEGLFRNTGEVCPLPEILKLKAEFCYRLILDETLSFGTLGKTGRGVTEHFGVKRGDVEITTLTLDTTLASVGGVCIGAREVVDHQRLSGAGYCFSASSPPFLSACAIKALERMEKEPSLLADLQSNAAAMFDKLKKVKHLSLQSSTATPVMSLVLSKPLKSIDDERTAIIAIADGCVRKGFGVVPSKFSLVNASETCRPALMVTASNSLTDKQITKLATVLSEVATAVLK